MISTNILTYTICSEICLILLLAVSYGFWIYHGYDFFLPTISNTWEEAPASWLSRFFGSIFATLIFLVITACYCIIKQLSIQRNEYKRVPLMIFIMATVGVFLFSWVPAICDTLAASCRGDDDIHTGCAVTFFVLVNLAFIIMYYCFYDSSSACETVGISFLNIISILCKIRFLPFLGEKSGYDLMYYVRPVTKPASQIFYSHNLLAIAEWTDVLIVLILVLVFVIKYYEGYSIALGSKSVAGKTHQVLYSFNTGWWAHLFAVMFSVELLFSLWANWYREIWTPDQDGVPTIEELQVYQPSNWTTHWVFMFGAITLTVAHCCVGCVQYTSAASSSARSACQYLFPLAFLAMLFLALEGIVTEDEDAELNQIFGYLFIGLYNSYMIGSIIFISCGGTTSKRDKIGVPFALMCICVFVCTLSKVRFAPKTMEVFTEEGLSPLWAWIDVEFCIVFAMMLISHYEKMGLNKYRIMIIQEQ